VVEEELSLIPEELLSILEQVLPQVQVIKVQYQLEEKYL